MEYDLIDDFERAVDANGYRSRDSYTEAEYSRSKKALVDAVNKARDYRDALLSIMGNGDATGCNPQIMADKARAALGISCNTINAADLSGEEYENMFAFRREGYED